jgi:hypothetical protein
VLFQKKALSGRMENLIAAAARYISHCEEKKIVLGPLAQAIKAALPAAQEELAALKAAATKTEVEK